MFHLVYNRQSKPLKITILSLLMVGLLSGCGIRGGLKTPPPVFGSESKDQDLDKDEDGDEDEDDNPFIDNTLEDI
jgi:predicted small lipoprotein YifL